jgi:tRNA pseudouridine38-40 synthase
MAYDGTGYLGWQIQPKGKTIQAVMEHALTTLLKQDIAVTGAGRTDTGVHASFYMAHFDATLPLESKEGQYASDPENSRFLFKLNRFLPDDIVVYRIGQVPEEWHARFSATYRTYHYRMSSIKPLFNRNHTHYIFGPLNVEEIGHCCGLILKTEDFTSFSKLHTDVKTNHCRVMAAEWKTVDNGYLFEIKADRFLRNMVRSLTGTLLLVGQGKLDRHDFKSIIEAKDRSKAGQSAPAQGLFLVDIGYDNLPFPTTAK